MTSNTSLESKASFFKQLYRGNARFPKANKLIVEENQSNKITDTFYNDDPKLQKLNLECGKYENREKYEDDYYDSVPYYDNSKLFSEPIEPYSFYVKHWFKGCNSMKIFKIKPADGADPANTASLKFNDRSRFSFHGEYPIVEYKDESKVRYKYPQSPWGKTGLMGRGDLPRWGPNHVFHAIITRWKRDDRDFLCINTGTFRPILQFLAYNCMFFSGLYLPNGKPTQFALPGTTVDSNEKTVYGNVLRSDLNRLTYDYVQLTNNTKLEDRVVNIISTNIFTHNKYSQDIHTGFVHDKRNTDNAWVEAYARQFHDNDGIFQYFDANLRTDPMPDFMRWLDIDRKVVETVVDANHVDYLKKTAHVMNAHY